MNGDPGVWRWRVVATPQDWPVLHVLAVAHPFIQGHAHSRAAARQRTRQLLREHAGAEIAGPVLAHPSGAPGAGRVSISHEDGWSLVAWCQRGCIGVDIVGPRGLAGASAEELQRVSGLYLGAGLVGGGPGPMESPALSSQDCRQKFAKAWARQEAKLKCLGLTLDEETADLRLRLAACHSERVVLPPEVGPGAAALEVWIAWCDDPQIQPNRDGPRHAVLGP